MSVFVFPGQGSQHRGMGASLWDEFSEYLQKADDILGYSLKELCLKDPHRQLGQTQFTQPALYVVNALTHLQHQQSHSTPPQYLAGHSLGEYNALLAAGVFDFETGLMLVQKRGELMNQAPAGAMAAIIGMASSQVVELLSHSDWQSIDVANLNAPSQTVISGLKEDIQRAQSLFEENGATYIPLNVSSAFHSRYMEAAQKEFSEFLQGFSFQTPQIPVIANITARPYPTDPSQVSEYLAKQITSSVHWTESVQYLWGKGQETYTELGPGNVLSGLIGKIMTESQPLEVSEATPSSEPLATQPVTPTITPESLGSDAFKKAHQLKYAYVAGAMYKGIGSKELVVRMGKAGLMGFLGTGGLSLERIEQDLKYIQSELSGGESYGMNLLCNLTQPEMEWETVALYLKYGVTRVEAAAYMQMTPSLVCFRLKGVHEDAQGRVHVPHHVLAKVSRPEVAEAFLMPPPQAMVDQLLADGHLTSAEAALSQKIPMAHDICVEADSGGHTDQGMPYVLMPAMLILRDQMMQKHAYTELIRVGAAGGIGTAHAAAAAFTLGADFILTGSINQCTPEAGTSDLVKDLLQQANVQDTAIAPAGDMFEIGAKVQVFRKGLLFPPRANKLYELWQRYDSLESIDEKTKEQIQTRYFKRSFDEVWEETKNYYLKTQPSEVERAQKNAKHKMALIFKWYFVHTNRIALKGEESSKVDFQIHCGPALGAFNQWVKGSSLEAWQNRHVDVLANHLMQETARYLNQRFSKWVS